MRGFLSVVLVSFVAALVLAMVVSEKLVVVMLFGVTACNCIVIEDVGVVY